MQISIFSEEETKGWDRIAERWYKFKNSRWGKLHDTIPWQALDQCLPEKKHNCGPAPYFDNKGMFAVLFLKHELGVSDEKLIDHINHNVSLQLFCGMRLAHGKLIRDTGIISRIRGYIAHQADLSEVQSILVGHWKEDMDFQHFLKMDATCMESGVPPSYIRFPTDVKLLWECCQRSAAAVGL